MLPRCPGRVERGGPPSRADANEDAPERPDDQERAVGDVASGGSPARWGSAPRSRRREERARDEAEERAERPAEQADADEELEVALPDRPRRRTGSRAGTARAGPRRRSTIAHGDAERSWTSGSTADTAATSASAISGSVMTSGSRRWSRSVAKRTTSASDVGPEQPSRPGLPPKRPGSSAGATAADRATATTVRQSTAGQRGARPRGRASGPRAGRPGGPTDPRPRPPTRSARQGSSAPYLPGRRSSWPSRARRVPARPGWRARTPVAPRGANGLVFRSRPVPAMSRWTHGTVDELAQEQGALDEAALGRRELVKSAYQLSMSARYSSTRGSCQKRSPARSAAAVDVVDERLRASRRRRTPARPAPARRLR